jgi:hypothetical protein
VTRLAALLLAAVAAGCAPALVPPGAPPAADAPGDPAALAAEVLALARRSEAEPSSARRASLSSQALALGLRCDRAAPATAPCDYALAIALGLQAREHPTTLLEGLAQMAIRLRRAAGTQPGLDQAGPDRVLALLLLQAPGWPLGPGDHEEGLAAARRAVALFPDHPPNQLALAEALLASGDEAGGRAAAGRALALAAAPERAGDPEASGWLRQARKLADSP